MLTKVISDFGSGRVRATTVAISDPGPLERYLSAKEPGSAFLRRGEGFVGLGEVARFETDYIDTADVWWTEIATQIDHDSELPGASGIGPLAVGSFAFDPDRSAFRSVLTIPRTIIGRRGGQYWLTQIGEHRNQTLPAPGDAPRFPEHLDLGHGTVTQDEWAGIVARCVELIRQGDIHKVVLARDLIAKADGPIDLRAVLGRLIERYPMTWTYLVDGMVGATPELLVRVADGLVTSRVLAGTISVDPDHTDPLAKAAQLARSTKDIREHEFAVESVAQALEPFCRAMNVPEAPSVLPLPNVLHLATDITGVADADVSALRLAAALHPSAAVCGTPTHLALDTIAAIENMDRGRYAGPVGWVDTEGDGEWAIALRGGYSGPDAPDQIRLFAGAGIVADSQPGAELEETRAKFVPMLQALGLD
ncbi:isochorismate synthase [Tessaracoccus oleiagri]|uniref:isochorismate synthase n=1 Tax=Tessaracoccus oleiagri TaxID=686624 RepID=A0A1G9KL61_9ACTN|nr:isochorismate synthase [Tessaracoccus oleiagri]